MTIAIEFDGVIVEDEYPKIGEEIPFAFDSLKKLQNRGTQVILWTRRSGKELSDAINFCKEHDFEFYAINKSYPEEVIDSSTSRKILADLYLENRMMTELPDWGYIYQAIRHRRFLRPIDIHHDFEHHRHQSKRKGLLGGLFSKKSR